MSFVSVASVLGGRQCLFQSVQLSVQEVNLMVVLKAYRSVVLEDHYENMGHLGQD